MEAAAEEAINGLVLDYLTVYCICIHEKTNYLSRFIICILFPSDFWLLQKAKMDFFSCSFHIIWCKIKGETM